MDAQPSLFDIAAQAIIIPQYDRRWSLEQRFWEFHRANPHVYDALVEMALDLRRQGVTHYGIGSLFEVLRYHRTMRTHDPEGWKVNNSYRSRYARLIMEHVPELRGFFETRELHTNSTLEEQ